MDTTCNQNNTYPSSGMSIYQGHVFPYEGYVIIPAHTLQGFFVAPNRLKTDFVLLLTSFAAHAGITAALLVYLTERSISDMH
jgi:hypothetical protein